MAEIARDLEPVGEGIGAVVKNAQLMQAMTSISGALAAFWNAVGDIVAAGQQDAMTTALEQSFEWDNVLLRLDLPARKRGAMKASLLSAGRFNVEAMLARVYITRLPLSQQVYKTSALAQGWVESRLDKAIAKGQTVAELTKEVRDFVNPNTPGGATYAARRLARTEINAAYHAVSIVHNEDKPWVIGMRWRLSGSHPTPDICDVMARNDHSGLGVGVYRNGDVPGKPHPQCFCTVIPVLMDETDFLRLAESGQLDEYIASAYGV